jgi:hypothetical protein
MIDHGLDLALIGNGRTAALVDPQSRIVWWCFPGFDVGIALLFAAREQAAKDRIAVEAGKAPPDDA